MIVSAGLAAANKEAQRWRRAGVLIDDRKVDPRADAINHVGQIAMLRRIAGAAMKGESYHKADIAATPVGAEQAPPRR